MQLAQAESQPRRSNDPQLPPTKTAKIMANLKWWRQLHWSEYGAEMLGTAFMIFVGLSAVVFNSGQGLLMEQLIPNKSIRLLITGLIFAGSGSLVAMSATR